MYLFDILVYREWVCVYRKTASFIAYWRRRRRSRAQSFLIENMFYCEWQMRWTSRAESAFSEEPELVRCPRAYRGASEPPINTQRTCCSRLSIVPNGCHMAHTIPHTTHLAIVTHHRWIWSKCTSRSQLLYHHRIIPKRLIFALQFIDRQGKARQSRDLSHMSIYIFLEYTNEYNKIVITILNRYWVWVRPWMLCRKHLIIE